MFHPLAPDLSTLKDEELYKRSNELMERLSFSRRSGNSQLTNQLQMLYNGYQEETQRRAAGWLERLNRKKKTDAEEPTNYDIG
jgi:formate dehydrogenase maturation protein FdhE